MGEPRVPRHGTRPGSAGPGDASHGGRGGTATRGSVHGSTLCDEPTRGSIRVTWPIRLRLATGQIFMAARGLPALFTGGG